MFTKHSHYCLNNQLEHCNYIEQKLMMYDYDSQSSLPNRDVYSGLKLPHRSPSKVSGSQLRQFNDNPRINIASNMHLKFDEYEDQWEESFLGELMKQIHEHEQNYSKNLRLLRYGEDQIKQQMKKRRWENRSGKNKKKQMAKYRAYAVKMKIPTNIQYQKIKVEQTEDELLNQIKISNKNRLKIEKERNFSRLEEIFRANVRDIAMSNAIENSNVNIFKKRYENSLKQANIRKRSVKQGQKKRQNELDNKQSIKMSLKTPSPHFTNKKAISSLDQSTVQHQQFERKAIRDEISNMKDTHKKNNTNCFIKPSSRSGQREKDVFMNGSKLRQFSRQEQPCSPQKLIQKIDQAIHFKSRGAKDQPIAESPKRQVKSRCQKTVQNFNFQQTNQASKTLTQTIYKSRDIIKNKSNVLKQSPSKQVQISRKQYGNKIFVFDSEDQYIRRILTKVGWIYNHDQKSQFYNLKWVFKPDSIDYHSIKPGQFVNHVKNSYQLTSKNYLNKNLKTYLSQWKTLYRHYPKCYDLAKSSEKQQFYFQFKKQIMMILLRNVYEFFHLIRRNKVQNLAKFYQSLLQEDGSYNYNNKKQSFLRRKVFRKIDMEDYKQYDGGFLMHMNLLIIALKYWRFLRKEEEIEENQEEFHFLNFKEKQFSQNLTDLERLSKMYLLYINLQQSCFQKQYFATPSDITIQRVVKQYIYFQNKYKEQWPIFGKGNIWIVKPCSASRGAGIYLANNCSEILTDNRGIQSKIVQKYIERPLIFKTGIAANKKFDLRQWVLLKSVEPLEIYMFSHCYVRICSQEFDINNIQNLKGHLTNYSFNKHHYKEASLSVFDQDTLQQLLLKEKGVSYCQYVRPKIKDIIIKSIKSAQHLLSDCRQKCFSLLGYDILIDEICQPWLLEVNMSPACEQRTQWLKNYLQVMGREMLLIMMPDLQLPKQTKSTTQNQQQQPRLTQQSKSNVFQLKKIDTQTSHLNRYQSLQIQIREQSTYINTIFQPDVCKQDLEASQDHIGDKITYQDFINQHGTDKEGEGSWELLEMQEGKDSNVFMEEKKEKFKNLQIYLKDQTQYITINSPQLLRKGTSDKNQSQQKKSNKITEQTTKLSINTSNKLGWQKIYEEQYLATKKDADFNLEIVGSRISPQTIEDIDMVIRYAEKNSSYVTKSCTKIQKQIRAFLQKSKLNEIKKEKFSLKINLSQLLKAQRQSKSHLLSQQQKKPSLIDGVKHQSIELSNTKSLTDQGLIAKTTSNINSKFKATGQTSFRDKIRSMAFQAANRQQSKHQQLRQSTQKNRVLLQKSPFQSQL